ncbi:MAG: hypothetical protein GY906_28580 [bacterium]|nr:hypothetical protein [bacterium]
MGRLASRQPAHSSPRRLQSFGHAKLGRWDMDGYDDGSVLRFSPRSTSEKRREEFIVPCLTAIIVLALGLLLVTVTCRTTANDAAPARETTSAQMP